MLFQRFYSALLSFACLALSLGLARAQNSPLPPPRILAPPPAVALVQKAQSAVQERNMEALEPLIEGEAATRFAWVQDRSEQGWKSGVLPVPRANNAQQEYLAVFYKWHTCEAAGDHAYRLVQKDGAWRIGDEILETETLGFRVRDHNIDLAANVAQKRITIRNVVGVERTVSEMPPFGVLRLSPDFQISSLRAGNGAQIPFRRMGSLVAFLPPSEKKFLMDMRYTGTVSHSGSDYVLENELTLNSYWYPHIARLPATLTLMTSAPQGWTPLAQGEVVTKRRNADGTTLFVFRNAIPTSYFTFNMGRYRIYSRVRNNLTLYAYLRSERTDKEAEKWLELTEKSIQFCASKFGKYPYTRYTLVETQGPFGGALEAYSFATFGTFAIPGAITHEVAHTWWGGIVPCAYTRSMWNESLANYTDALFSRQSKADEVLPAENLLSMRRNLAKAFHGATLMAGNSTSNGDASAVGYGKGSLVFRVLEEELGQDTLIRCLRAFLEAHPRGEAAEWKDIEAAVHRVTGQDYRWFFEQWGERTGLPFLKWRDVKLEQSGNETFLTGAIVQTGVPYRIKTPVRIEYSGGVPATESILRVEGGSTTFRIAVKGTPRSITIDPRNTLPLASPASDVGNPYVHPFEAERGTP